MTPRYGPDLTPTSAREISADRPAVELPQHRRKLQRRADRENHRRGEQAGKVLPGHQHLAPDGREQVEMEALVQHLTAEQVHENADASEEDRQSQVIKLKDRGKDGGELRAAYRDCHAA